MDKTVTAKGDNTMRARKINTKAAKTLARLTRGLGDDNRARKIGSDDGGYMPVHVDYLQTAEGGAIYSVAHYYRKNGDSMPDPDMTFYHRDEDDAWFPLTWQTGGRRDEAMWHNGEGWQFRPALQRSITTFAGSWMANIKTQQAEYFRPMRRGATG